MDAAAWDERYAATDLVWTAEPNRFVVQECADLPAGTAVDLAAGEGRNAIWLARNGWTVFAVDFAQRGLDKGRRVAGDLPVEWVHADALSYAPPQPVDLYVIAYLQLAEAERRAAVVNAFDHVRIGGHLVVVAHDSTNLTEGTGGPQHPDVLMTAGDLIGDLGDRVFDVVRAGRVARPVTHDDGHGGTLHATAWDCLVHVVRRH